MILQKAEYLAGIGRLYDEQSYSIPNTIEDDKDEILQNYESLKRL